MESELKTLNPNPAQIQPTQRSPPVDDNLTKDDRPLLKPEPVPPGPTQNPATTTAPDIEELEKKYAAYVRRDVYGVMGRGDLPWVEKLLLGLALVTLVPLRLVSGLTVLVLYYFICRICTAFLAPNREDEQEDYAHMGGWRRAVIVQTGRFCSRALLFIFGFYWISETHRDIVDVSFNGKFGTQTESKDQSQDSARPGVIVSNHVSYLDILYHMSSSFPSFVAKRSVAKLPLVGLISKCLGCVYVQRESKSSDFKGVSGIVNDRIKEAHQDKNAPMMMLFPEGTTTNGDFLLPFKTGAFLAKAPVLPVILRYPYQRFSPAWDSISGVRHVFFLLCQFVNYMEVTKLPVYHPSQQEKDDPRLYAENVRRLMAHEGGLVLSDIGLAEKRVYHAALNGVFCQQ
ncbi:lysophospholipid acyltransferase LPEAT1 isoform X6 [Coffea arabica]|uniref:Lysophospholipid acyltransferase LPEAT1 isoform X6 n=1 Tax=Coffea arabica TaxID=13443 RepID=A0A6P6ULW1_COFAR|nr:lysophospholipid acyltransferase LPEAT1-like isoform X4 [Coffea arabica]XP_027091816.1 lysophospholipid acyltransferase LPEAT1-like isoform X4 [Coffea arabica]